MAHTNGATAPESSTDCIDELHLIDFEASMTMQQLHDSEVGYDELWRPKRRIALLALTRTKADLVASFTKSDSGPELLMEMIEHVQDWASHLKDGIDIAEQATARLTVACATAINQEEST
jgi:hypothetical protein